MQGVYQLSGKYLFKEIESCLKTGLNKFILFGIPSKKDLQGSDTWNEKGVIQSALRAVKKEFPETFLVTDVCFCEYTSHGYCGVPDKNHYLMNDATLANLTKQTLSHCEAGADMVAPSGMIDGMVAVMREAMDKNGFEEIPVMSYAVKYASNFYGPFREAAESQMPAPTKSGDSGDRKTHQMNYANAREAISEALEDVKQGADIIMVKPAMPCLDIIRAVRKKVNTPVAAYQVSGEYSMLREAVRKKWLNEDAIMESLTAIKRAGAGIIISYFAKEVLPKI